MAEKNKIFRLLSKIFFVGGIYLIMFLIIFFSKELSSGIKNGINVSINLIIPSMFIFMIFSNIVINSKLRDLICRPFLFLAKYVFRISKGSLAIVILSLVGGYPVGAKLIANAVNQGTLTQRQAENMLCYCVNCGPAFLISGVGVTIFASFKIGVYLYISQIIACIFTGFILSFFGSQKEEFSVKPPTYLPYSQLFVRSVNDSVKAMAVICGFIVAFCSIMPVIEVFLSSFNSNISLIIQGLLEVTVGCSSLATVSTGGKIILAALFTSFGGICVHLQIYAMVSPCKIRVTKFMLMRIIYTAISVLSMKIMLLLTPDISSCISYNTALKRDIYSVSPTATIFMIFLSIMLLFFSKKSDRM